MKSINLLVNPSNINYSAFEEVDNLKSFFSHENINKNSFKSTIQVLLKLKDKGYIENDLFLKLLTESVSIYIENEVNNRVYTAIEKEIQKQLSNAGF